MSDSRIRAEILAGVLDADGVAERCGAGARCGGCRPVVEALVAEVAVGLAGAVPAVA